MSAGQAKGTPAPIVTVYQAGRQILASGTLLVSRRSAPLVVAYGADVLTIHLDLDVPFRRGDGRLVGGPHGPDSIGPEESKERPLGDAVVSYGLTVFPAGREGLIPPQAAGRHGPTSWLLSWEVWRDAPGMMVPALPEPEWDLPLLAEHPPVSMPPPRVPNAHLGNPWFPAQ